MKKIGIIFALKEELDETKKLFDNIKTHSIYNLEIYECQSEKNICYLVESGMGKVNAARSAQVLIDKMDVEYILNVGVAGSVSRDVNKGDIVVGDKLVQHDYDAIMLGLEKGELPGIGKYIDCDPELVEIAKSVATKTNVTIGTIASGDIFVSDEEMGAKINQKFNALCVEMEGAAIAQVCYLCNVPFLVIRAISDSPYDENNHITFEELLEISSDMVGRFIEQFLKKI